MNGVRSVAATALSLGKYTRKMSGQAEKSITRVLFCGPQFAAADLYTREYLQAHQPLIQVDNVPLDGVADVIGNYDMCVVKLMRLNSSIISRATKMKLIMQFGVGLEGVDVPAATKHGIKVAKIPSAKTGNASSCAEMAIYLMLGLLRKQNEMEISVKKKFVGQPVGEPLLGKTVFIMGFGDIGFQLAKRLRPFGVKILATKRSWVPTLESNGGLSVVRGTCDDLIDEKGGMEDFHRFAQAADIVVCCLAMNSETAGIVNKSFISSMKKIKSSCIELLTLVNSEGLGLAVGSCPSILCNMLTYLAKKDRHKIAPLLAECGDHYFEGAHLVNIARGGLLDYEAVLYHLKSGHLGGLGIDVAWTEPFDPDDPVLKFPNVILTPHVAGVTEYSYRSMAEVVGNVAIQLQKGVPLTGIEFVN